MCSNTMVSVCFPVKEATITEELVCVSLLDVSTIAENIYYCSRGTEMSIERRSQICILWY